MLYTIQEASNSKRRTMKRVIWTNFSLRFTGCFSLTSASFVGSYPLPHALDCSDHATLKSVSMHWKTDLPTPRWTLFLARRQETTTSNSLPWSLLEDNWAPLVQVPLDSGVNSDTSRIRTPLKAVRRALPRPPRQSNSYAFNRFVHYAPQSSINYEKKKKSYLKSSLNSIDSIIL